MSKTLITDTLDKTVRSTGFKATLQRDAEAVTVEKAEKNRLDRIAKDKQEHEDWRSGRKDSVDLIGKVKQEMVKAADAGNNKIKFTVASGKDRTTETAYDRGLLDGLATWLRWESFKFEVSRSSIAEDEAGPASYHVHVNVSW